MCQFLVVDIGCRGGQELGGQNGVFFGCPFVDRIII